MADHSRARLDVSASQVSCVAVNAFPSGVTSSPRTNEKPAQGPVSCRLRISQSPFGGPSSPPLRDRSSKRTQQAKQCLDIIYRICAVKLRKSLNIKAFRPTRSRHHADGQNHRPDHRSDRGQSVQSAVHAFFSALVSAPSRRTSTAKAGSACAKSMTVIRCSSVMRRAPLRHCIMVCLETFRASATAASLSRLHESRALSSNLFRVSMSPSC